MEPDTPNFNSVARAYRWMEYCTFGPTLERCRFHFLTQCSRARRALVLGDGDGRFTARLLSLNSAVHVDAVDASAEMLAILRERAQNCCDNAASRLQTIQADIRRFTPPNTGYDLVVSHFFLDCLTEDEVNSLVARLSPHMTREAAWLVSEFAVPKAGWRRLTARIVIRGLYSAFSVLTGLRLRQVPNYANGFRDNGFYLADNANYLGGMLVTEGWKRQSG
jgi:SAM-dependent methyltransferase